MQSITKFLEVLRMRQWVLMHYRIPNQPSAGRVYIWRKMKSLGAKLLHDSVWVLPYTPRTYEQFQWLATEISDLKGEAMLWQASLTLREQEDQLIEQFSATVLGEYEDILADLQASQANLAELARRYHQVKIKDYFGCALGQQVYEILLQKREESQE